MSKAWMLQSTLMAALLVSAAMPSQAVTLVENGQAKATIVLRPAASMTERFAAEELQKYVQQMSGAKLPIAVTAAGAKVLVGEGVAPFNRAASFAAGDGAESFVLHTQGESLALLGNSDRSTLYAVYALLERLGVRFFAPGFVFYDGYHELVPRRTTIALDNLNVREKPAFKWRRKYVEEGWSHTANTLPQLLDWMAKNRLNVLVYPYDYQGRGMVTYETWREKLAPEAQKRDIVLQVGGHGYQSFLQPIRYAAQHPAWFVEGFNVFNVENDEALNTYVANVITYLKSRPEIRIFDAWPPDGAKWPPSVIQKFGSIANAQAHVTNRLNAAVQRELPGVRVENIAYTPAIEPPDAGTMYGPAVLIDFAWFGRSYRDPIYESAFPRNVMFNSLIKKWRDNGFKGDTGIYEYYRKYAWHSLPVVLPKLIGLEIRHYQKQGANGLGIYSEPADWMTYEVTHALVAALSWDTNIKADNWMSAYLRDRYGAGAPAMQKYFEAVEDAGRTLFHKAGGGDFGQKEEVTRAREKYLQAKAALSEARAQAPAGSAATLLIERLDWNADFAIADTEVYYYGKSVQDEPAKAQAARERLRELTQAHRFDGVILQNSYSTRRYGGSPQPNQGGMSDKARRDLHEMYRRQW